jgi:hypothetical protein
VNDSDVWYWERTWNDFRRGEVDVPLTWDGGAAVVRIFDQGVPVTANALLAKLPIEVPVVHVAWSGDMVMSTRQYDIGVRELENHVRLMRPGDVAFDARYGEITATYGTAEARLPSGPNTLTVFGTISRGLDSFAVWARARRFEGLGLLRLG